MSVRTYLPSDKEQVINLWKACNLTVPWNDPAQDIARKVAEEPQLFLVYVVDRQVLGTCMAGYDGHRGWLYYLGVHPTHRKRGIAAILVTEAEHRLRALGCPKINLMVRQANREALSFYGEIGYKEDPVLVLSKRLTDDEKCGQSARTRNEPENSTT